MYMRGHRAFVCVPKVRVPIVYVPFMIERRSFMKTSRLAAACGLAIGLVVFLFLPSCSPQKDEAGPGAAAGRPALAPASSEEASAWAAKTLAGLTLEKKVGQLICPDLAGGYIADDDPRMRQWVKLARDHGVGMFVFYGGTP